MADLTPAEILVPPGEDGIKEKLIARLQAIPGLAIDDWEVGGVLRTLVELEATADADLFGAAVPATVGSASVDFANPAWLTTLAEQLYSLTRGAAVVAIQNLRLDCDGSHGPYTIAAGTLWFQGAGGNRWVNRTGGALATSGSLAIQIQAEGPGARYNDPGGTVRTMLTALGGVTAVNAASDFGPVTAGLLSTGTIAPSRTSGGTAPSPATFAIRIDSSGQVGAGAWSYSADGGRTFVSGGVIATTALVRGGLPSGTTVTFSNGASTPSFVAGDQFVVVAPGSSFVTAGRDAETAATLGARCTARWPDLTRVRSESRYLGWARAASAEVTRVRLEEDAVYLGRLYVTLAGVVGGVTGPAVAAVKAYINPRAPIGRIVVARTATTQEITASGVVQVRAASVAAVQGAAQIRWQAVLLASDIGQIVRVADLVRVVMDAGAVDFTAPQLNGGGNVVLASTEVAILDTTTPLLSSQLTWEAV